MPLIAGLFIFVNNIEKPANFPGNGKNMSYLILGVSKWREFAMG